MLTEHAAPFNPAFDSAARRAAICAEARMIRKKPGPDLIRGGYRLSEKIMRN